MKCNLRSKIGATLMAMVVLTLWMSHPAGADTLWMQSGDRISGQIVEITATNLLIKTHFAGTLHVKLTAVKTMVSHQPVKFISRHGQIHTAYVEPNAKRTGWRETQKEPLIAADLPAPLHAPVALAAAVVPAKPQSIFGPHWNNELDLGATNITGNTQQTEFAGSVRFHYLNQPNDLNMDVTGAYGTTNGVQDAGRLGFGAIYRRLLPQWQPHNRWYAFAETHELYDAIRGISFQTNDLGGLGYKVFTGPKFEMDLRAGPGYLYETFFHGGNVSTETASAGLHLKYVLNSQVNLTNNELYTQGLKTAYDYYATSITALNIALPQVYRGFGLRLEFDDFYDNTAGTTGKKRNDTRFIAALTLKF